MMRQFSSVRFSLYHARYSPLTRLFRTVMFFACQKASFVSNVQPSKTASSMYWNEYFPVIRTSRRVSSDARSIKYSLSALQPVISMPRDDQPNSAEMMSQPRSRTSLHSRSALMPCRRVLPMCTLSQYQSAARQSGVISQSSMVRFRSCQKG